MSKKKIKHIAILDTETSSADPLPNGEAIEVAVTLYDLEHAQPGPRS